MYTWEGMKKISYKEALTSDTQVYLLYGDDTEGAAESDEDMKMHYENGGEFGIEL